MSWNMFDTFHTRDDFAVGFTVADTLTINRMSSLCWHASPSQVVHPPNYVSLMRCMAPSYQLCSFLSDLNWRSKQASKRCFSFVILQIFFCAQWQDDHCERTFLGHLVMLLAFFWSHIENSSFFVWPWFLSTGDISPYKWRCFPWCHLHEWWGTDLPQSILLSMSESVKKPFAAYGLPGAVQNLVKLHCHFETLLQIHLTMLKLLAISGHDVICWITCKSFCTTYFSPQEYGKQSIHSF